MLPIPPELEELYDGTGKHLAGIYPPLAVDNVLTPDYKASKAARPLSRCLHGPTGPTNVLGLVWMMPVSSSPMLISRHALGAMVLALDLGHAVVMHAHDEQALNGAEHLAALFAGGGHV